MTLPPLLSLHSSIERFAQHEAKRTEQKARGELERQKLNNEKEAEEARHLLLKLQAVASAVESSGQAKAEAQAHAQRLLIEGQSAIECEWGSVNLGSSTLTQYKGIGHEYSTGA